MNKYLEGNGVGFVPPIPNASVDMDHLWQPILLLQTTKNFFKQRISTIPLGSCGQVAWVSTLVMGNTSSSFLTACVGPIKRTLFFSIIPKFGVWMEGIPVYWLSCRLVRPCVCTYKKCEILGNTSMACGYSPTKIHHPDDCLVIFVC